MSGEAPQVENRRHNSAHDQHHENRDAKGKDILATPRGTRVVPLCNATVNSRPRLMIPPFCSLSLLSRCTPSLAANPLFLCRCTPSISLLLSCCMHPLFLFSRCTPSIFALSLYALSILPVHFLAIDSTFLSIDCQLLSVGCGNYTWLVGPLVWPVAFCEINADRLGCAHHTDVRQLQWLQCRWLQWLQCRWL